MRLCDEAKIELVLKVKKGHVNPFALVNDHEARVKLVVDENLMKLDYWAFHPIENTATVEILRDDFIKIFLTHINRNQTVVDLSSLDTGADQEASEKPSKPVKGEKPAKKEEVKGETLLKLTVTKNENPSEWYQQVITKTQLIDYYEVSGCYILRPAAYFIWEQIT